MGDSLGYSLIAYLASVDALMGGGYVCSREHGILCLSPYDAAVPEEKQNLKEPIQQEDTL